VDFKDARGGLFPPSSGSLSLPPVAAPQGCFSSLATCVVCGCLPRQHLSLVCAQCEDLECILDGTPTIGAFGFDRIPPELMTLRGEVMDSAWQQRLNGNHEPWLDFLHEAYRVVADNNSGCRHDGYLVGIETNPGPGDTVSLVRGPVVRRRDDGKHWVIKRVGTRSGAANAAIISSLSNSVAQLQGAIDARCEQVAHDPPGKGHVTSALIVPQEKTKVTSVLRFIRGGFDIPFYMRSRFSYVREAVLGAGFAAALHSRSWWARLMFCATSLTFFFFIRKIVIRFRAWLLARAVGRAIALPSSAGYAFEPERSTPEDFVRKAALAVELSCSSGGLVDYANMVAVGKEEVDETKDYRICTNETSKMGKRAVDIRLCKYVDDLNGVVRVVKVEQELFRSQLPYALQRGASDTLKDGMRWLNGVPCLNIPSASMSDILVGNQLVLHGTVCNHEALSSFSVPNFWLGPVVVIGATATGSLMLYYRQKSPKLALLSTLGTVIRGSGSLCKWLLDQFLMVLHHVFRMLTTQRL